MWSWLSSTIIYFYTKSSTRKPPPSSFLPPGPGLSMQPLALCHLWTLSPHEGRTGKGVSTWSGFHRGGNERCLMWPAAQGSSCLVSSASHSAGETMKNESVTADCSQTMNSINSNAHKGSMYQSVAMEAARTMKSGWLENRHKWQIWNLGVVESQQASSILRPYSIAMF